MVFQPYDQNYKFLSNEGYIFSYLISILARFEFYMAIDKVFEKNLFWFQNAKIHHILDFLSYGKFFSKTLPIAIKSSNLANLDMR